MKDMNMNSVRLSHYPADPEFLEACDSLGLYVMDELEAGMANTILRPSTPDQRNDRT